MTYDELTEKVVADLKNELYKEKKYGCPKSYFMAYHSLLREYRTLRSVEEIQKIWFYNRVYIKLMDYYRNEPGMFYNNLNIKGMDKIINLINGGGVFATFHYGNYRDLLYTVTMKVTEKYPDVPIAIIVDQDSYDKRPKYCNETRQKFEYIIADSPDVAFKLAHHLKKGGWVYIFLDGNTGTGKDKHGLNIEFITSNITIRSGFFRLLSILEKPVVPIIAAGPLNSNIYSIYKPIYISKNELEKSAQEIYETFKEKILDKPEYWRFWFRHYLQVNEWSDSNEKLPQHFSEFVCKLDEKDLIINDNTGKIYVQKH